MGSGAKLQWIELGYLLGVFSTTDVSGSTVLGFFGLSPAHLATTLKMYELLRTISEAPFFRCVTSGRGTKKCFHTKVPR